MRRCRPVISRSTFFFSIALFSAIGFGFPSTAEAAERSKGSSKPVKIRLPESVRRPPEQTMEVAPVSPSGRGQAERAAAEIDLAIRDAIFAAGKQPNPPASDETFVRRLYLDVAGRIPTLQEVTEFLDSNDPNKRRDLVDRLLGSPDYVSNFYNFWADTLRLVERPQPNLIASPYLAYVKDSIRTNKRYDQWVYEMLTADGKTWDNPATGFQLRDDGMALPYVDNTVRVFLGTQIGCAQCHDHPFDSWSQYQFYQLAAFTAGTRTRLRRGTPQWPGKANPSSELINEARKHYDKGRVPGAYQRLARANTYVVSEIETKLRLPHDYAYSDAKPKEVVEPEVLWGEIPSGAKDSSPRGQFAAWLTSADNERFSRTIANRLWKRLMGLGVVEPVDDFNDDNPATNEALLETLAEEVVRSDFDLKQFMRAILYSDAYAAQSSDFELTSGEDFHFEGPVLKRMTAEQIWDSLLTMAVANPMPFERPDAKTIAPHVDVDFRNATYETLRAQSEKFAKNYFLNHYKRTLNQHAYQGNVLCRASELPTPLPADHFLRQFGQGDREVINGEDDSATVPQILAMFNGPITHVMLEPGSKIVEDVLAIPDTRDRVDAIFLSVLSRRPNSADRRIAALELSQQRNDNVGYGNIIWALLNTREFLFVP